jgi:flavin-dependent dehydrogenase
MSQPVIVIGGGLGGLALSIDLKKRGQDVTLIEKGEYPRHKVCGEYIALESYPYLKRICPSLEGINLPFITEFQLTSTGKSTFKVPLNPGGFGISRFKLESLLYEEAMTLGVNFMLNTKVNSVLTNTDGTGFIVKTNSKEINATLVCNASGRKSNLETATRQVTEHQRNYIGVKYHIRLERNSSLIEIHNFPGGYCGISNIEDGQVCLCYMVNSEKLKASGNSIPDLEKQVLFRNPQLKHIFENAQFLFSEPLTISGINFRIKQASSDHSLFLGDSAGSIAPITGNGMSMALRAAAQLAKEIDSYLSGKKNKQDMERDYVNFWNDSFSRRIQLSRHFQKLSEYPALTRMTISLFNAFPGIAKQMISLTHGDPF